MPPEIVEEIYKEIEKNELDGARDYEEDFYQYKKKEESVPKVITDKDTETEEDTLDKDLALLQEGTYFTKYGRKGKPHSRFVRLSEDNRQMLYLSEGCFGSCKSIPTATVN